MCANHSTTRAILPHFTGLTDRLPYGSGGFLLYQDSVVSVGIEPTTHRFSVCCSTNWATTPIASAYLCKGCRGTDYPSLLFCCPGRTRTSIKWLTVTRNNLYTTRQFLWFPRESNPILKIFSLACRPLTQENQVMIMLEYPSRSNLNCLFVVLRCTGRGWLNSLTYRELSTFAQ